MIIVIKDTYLKLKLSTLNNYTIQKQKKMTVLGKDELGKKFMTEFEGLRPETYPYLIDDGSV